MRFGKCYLINGKLTPCVIGPNGVIQLLRWLVEQEKGGLKDA